jgi:hypothetical protein
MSRTTLCVLTAALLALLSAGVMLVRHRVLGEEVKAAGGPNTWRVSLLARGKSNGDARLITTCPLDLSRQHVVRETGRSAELIYKPAEGRHAERRLVYWTQRPGQGKGAFQARYEFYCRVDVHRPTSPMSRLTRTLYAPPPPGEHVKSEPRLDPSDPEISDLALRLTKGLSRPADQVRTLFRFVDEEISNEPSVGGGGLSAAECLKAGSGDAAAKSRLLTALCRNRGIPARLVTGLALARGPEQTAHVWVEAWVGDHWMPLCPFYHRCGRVPPTYLVFGYGDLQLVRGHNVRDLDYACLVEHRSLPDEAAPTATPVQRFFAQISLYNLPPSQRSLVEFLLLLPVAALIICLYRNVIGVNSFGTFAPALVGLAFRELESLPGILVFVSIVLIGWGMRRVLDRYHLLQVPRSAFLLSLVVILLLTTILLANFREMEFTHYFSLFPMVILTGMIERFWTLETEDGTPSSFKTLLGTMLIAATISLVVSLRAVVEHMFRYPETLGLIMAGQLLIGRYTGYRVSELFRFRDFVQQPA